MTVILGSTENPNYTNTDRTKLNLCQLNSMGEPIQFEYEIGAWQISENKIIKYAAQIVIFLSHMELWAKDLKSESSTSFDHTRNQSDSKEFRKLSILHKSTLQSNSNLSYELSSA